MISGFIGIAEGRINNATNALTLYRDSLALQRDALTLYRDALALQGIAFF
ncbi:MAG: hypothetical protein V7K48_20560 [Nostoc sp.]